MDTKDTDIREILQDIVRWGRVYLYQYTSKYQREQMGCEVLDQEAELECVGLPHMFSKPRKMEAVFRHCNMPEDVREKFAERFQGRTYYRVKDRNKQRWYVYTQDWRYDRRTFKHSVLPVGHIEPTRYQTRQRPLPYTFCMYSEETLAQRNQQSLYIADYRVEVTPKLCELLKWDSEWVGAYLEFEVYNDWALQAYRQAHQIQPARRFSTQQLAEVPETLTCA